MQKNVFTQIVVFIATVLLILMFFFPNYREVKTLILNRVEVINLLLIIGLYLRDLFRS
ncbi:MAG: hypothetical protein PHF84_09240 [bacterium]|nr:hypothetical protein [bacterium]